MAGPFVLLLLLSLSGAHATEPEPCGELMARLGEQTVLPEPWLGTYLDTHLVACAPRVSRQRDPAIVAQLQGHLMRLTPTLPSRKRTKLWSVYLDLGHAHPHATLRILLHHPDPVAKNYAMSMMHRTPGFEPTEADLAVVEPLTRDPDKIARKGARHALALYAPDRFRAVRTDETEWNWTAAFLARRGTDPDLALAAEYLHHPIQDRGTAWFIARTLQERGGPLLSAHQEAMDRATEHRFRQEGGAGAEGAWFIDLALRWKGGAGSTNVAPPRVSPVHEGEAGQSILFLSSQPEEDAPDADHPWVARLTTPPGPSRELWFAKRVFLLGWLPDGRPVLTSYRNVLVLEPEPVLVTDNAQRVDLTEDGRITWTPYEDNPDGPTSWP